MKRNKYIFSMIAAAAVCAASCTDFDDYNEAYTNGSPESRQTLWDNIESQSDLTQFAALCRKVGYDKELKNSRTYTVWAPTDGTFDYDSLMNEVDSARLVDRFMKSHVANYNYTISADINERVHTLNEKSYPLELQNGVYTYDMHKMVQTNIPSINGTLHKISGFVEYLPNVYEYIFETGDTLLSAYFKYFEHEYLDVDNSVEGAIDSLGNQTYTDSVMIVSNDLSRRLDAKLDNEDSSYVMLMPTDDAYVKAHNRIKPYFKYASTLEYFPISQLQGVMPKTSVEVDAEYMTDSLSKLFIPATSIFSTNISYNRWVPGEWGGNTDGNWQVDTDTLYSTTRARLSNGKELLSHRITDPIKMSNGYAFRVDSLAYLPWEVWAPEIHVNMFSTDFRPLVKSASASVQTVRSGYLDTSKGYDLKRYLMLRATSNSAQPEAYFFIDGVLATSYNVYVVAVPANIEKGSTAQAKQIKLQVALNYAGADGKLTGTTSKPTTTFATVTSDSTKLDTIHVGKVTFPVAYNNTGVYPYLMIKSMRSGWNMTEWNTVDNTLRIGAIILRPVEYDEYLKKDEE